MNVPSQTLKRSELINRLVLDRRSAEEIGRVEQIWLDPQLHRAISLTCKQGFLGKTKQTFSWSQVETIGSDSMMVNSDTDVETSATPSQGVSAIGHEVWTDSGNKVGKLVDYLLEPLSGAVVYYLFSSSGWRGILEGIYVFSPTSVASIGSKRMIVADAAVQEPELFAEGLNKKITQAAEILKEDYQKTQRDLGVMRRNAQDMAEQAKDRAQVVGRRAQEMAEQAKDRAQEVANKAKEKISEVQSQRREATTPESAEVTTEPTVTVVPESFPPNESENV